MRYLKPKKSISYFVQYRTYDNKFNFGKIILFFTLHDRTMALIRHFVNCKPYSSYFKESYYYALIQQPMDLYYFVLKETNTFCVIKVEDIITHTIPFKNSQDVSTSVVTPVSSIDEHD